MRGERIMARGRKLAAERMSETITVGFFTDGVDDLTGDPTRVIAGDPLYEGIAQVKYPNASVRSSVSSGQEVTAQSVIVKIPAGGVVIPEGATVQVTASTVDPALVDRFYTVTGAPDMGQVTAHRYPVEEL